MELRDLIVTPIIIFLVYAGAYWIRPRVTDSVNRRYFIPALTVRIIGALAVGFLYQFYYDGGDTFNFHTHGSRVIWEAFWDSPLKGLKLLFASGEFAGDTFLYSNRIPFYQDKSSFFVIRVSSLIDLLTYSSYSATAVIFALFSFIGLWLLFISFYELFPYLHKWIAFACFFIPSVFFWGAGILKDTLTLTCIGVIVYCVKRLFINKNFSLGSIILLLTCVWIIFIVKKYILLCLIPSILIWVYAHQLHKIKLLVVRIILVPIIGLLILLSCYWAVVKIGEDDSRYSIDKIAKTAKVTAYDIGFYTGKDAGSGYSLGELDGSFVSMLRLGPSAINVSLFRPYIWEVKNPLMLLSSIESILLATLVLSVLFKKRLRIFRSLVNPAVLFCLVFSIIFAFAVGVSTYNFGTLSRYKIPLLPFFVIALAIVKGHSNSERKVSEFDFKE